jgi:hypothetical protein
VLANTLSTPAMTAYSLLIVVVSFVISMDTGITPVVVSIENQYQLFKRASKARIVSLLNLPLLVDVLIEFEYNQ